MNQLQNLVKYRNLKLNDINFIYSTWLKSYRQSPWAESMSNDIFFSQHKVLIDSIIARPTASVIVICNPEDEEQVYGYLVSEANLSILHFAYIKYNYRKLGMMKSLLGQLGCSTTPSVTFITHLPRRFDMLKTKFNLQYNPYLLLNQ